MSGLNEEFVVKICIICFFVFWALGVGKIYKVDGEIDLEGIGMMAFLGMILSPVPISLYSAIVFLFSQDQNVSPNLLRVDLTSGI